MHKTWSSFFRVVITLALTVLGVLFFRSTHNELRAGYEALRSAKIDYVLFTFFITGVLVAVQAQTMRFSYRTVRKTIPLLACINLYLKRFFLSPFIPGGFSVAQYTLTRDLEQYGVSAPENAFASTIFVLTSSVSYILVLTITLIATALHGSIQASRFYTGLLVFSVGLIILGLIIYVFRTEILTRIRAWVKPHVGHFDIKPLIFVLISGLVADVLGIITLWTSLRAVGFPISVESAALGYIITILILTLSPLFQGLVVVESALVYTLKEFGVPAGPAFAGAIVFRSFQLWVPLLAGAVLYIIPNVLRWLHSGHRRLFKS